MLSTLIDLITRHDFSGAIYPASRMQCLQAPAHKADWIQSHPPTPVARPTDWALLVYPTFVVYRDSNTQQHTKPRDYVIEAKCLLTSILCRGMLVIRKATGCKTKRASSFWKGFLVGLCVHDLAKPWWPQRIHQLHQNQ